MSRPVRRYLPGADGWHAMRFKRAVPGLYPYTYAATGPGWKVDYDQIVSIMRTLSPAPINQRRLVDVVTEYRASMSAPIPSLPPETERIEWPIRVPEVRRVPVVLHNFDVLDDGDDESLPVEQTTKESLMAAGYDESRATFIMAVANGEIDGDCVVERPAEDGSRDPEILAMAAKLREGRARMPYASAEEAYAQQARAMAGMTKAPADVEPGRDSGPASEAEALDESERG